MKPASIRRSASDRLLLLLGIALTAMVATFGYGARGAAAASPSPVEPTPTLTPIVTPTATPSPSPEPTPSPSPEPTPTDSPPVDVLIEIWPVVRPPGVTEGVGAPGWRYTAEFDGADVRNFDPVTSLEVPAFWFVTVPLGETARVRLTQIRREGFSLEKVRCTEITVPPNGAVGREIAVTLRGDTASFEIGGIDPSYLCYFFNPPIGLPPTDSDALREPSNESPGPSLVIFAAILAAALVLATRRLHPRPR